MTKKSGFFLILLLSLVPLFVRAQDVIEGSVPVVLDGVELGEVKVGLDGERLIWIEKDSAVKVLADDVPDDTLKALSRLSPSIDAKTFPLPLHFDPANLRLDLKLPAEGRRAKKLDLMEDHHRRYQGESLAAAPVSGAINYRLEQSWTTHQQELDTFSAQLQPFLNVKGVVLENQTLYQSRGEDRWFRGDTRLVTDFEKSQVRASVGDVYPSVQGFMVARPVGGLNVARNFNINPYRLPYATGSQTFVLQTRSSVKYFVNGTLIKSEILPAGNYTATDIPLNNGLNTVLIEATDDLGQKRTFVFRTAASINLLNEGESRFDLTYGTTFEDQNFDRKYLYNNGELFSGYYQYGFSQTFSASAYAQDQEDHTLLGGEVVKATTIGNFNLGHAGSKSALRNGNAQSVGYQLLGQGSTFALRFEHRSRNFQTSLFEINSLVKNNYAGSIALPLSQSLSISLGGNYGEVRDNGLEDRYGFDSSFNLRLFGRHNLSLFVGRNRDEFKRWNDVAYLFLTITFPDRNDFITTLYDHQQKTTRVTAIRDNQNKLYEPRAQTVIEDNPDAQSAEVDLLMPLPFAELGGRVQGQHIVETDKGEARGSVRMQSAFVFAYDDGLAAGLARPVPQSFALIKPDQRLKGQKIALRSTSPYTEAQTGPFGDITFNNLLAYQYREIQLDPTQLDDGRALAQEKFVLYPTYRSGHLIHLKDRGAVMLKGRLVGADGKPLSLQVGKIGDLTFFTNRNGEFFIDGVEPGSHVLKIDGREHDLSLTIPKEASGIKNLGNLIYKDDEE